MKEIEKEQIKICNKYGVSYTPTLYYLKVGIAENVKEGIRPLNGLRHQQEAGTSGWYIWAGEKLSDDPNFFVPLHVEHIAKWCPLILKYLGLPPGWRFLVTESYVDIWEDKTLLNI